MAPNTLLQTNRDDGLVQILTPEQVKEHRGMVSLNLLDFCLAPKPLFQTNRDDGLDQILTPEQVKEHRGMVSLNLFDFCLAPKPFIPKHPITNKQGRRFGPNPHPRTVERTQRNVFPEPFGFLYGPKTPIINKQGRRFGPNPHPRTVERTQRNGMVSLNFCLAPSFGPGGCFERTQRNVFPSPFGPKHPITNKQGRRFGPNPHPRTVERTQRNVFP